MGPIVLTLLAACSGDPDTPGPDTTAEPIVETEGCDGAARLQTPEDAAVMGPWPVGARTAEVGRLTAEVWYPAVPGSQQGETPLDYDIRYALPDSQRDKIGDDIAPSHPCACYDALPLDDRGPFPVVVFIHGTASWRSQSLSLATLWASRGFVVVSADHPGLWLADALALVCPDEPTGDEDIVGDVDAVLAALADPRGDLAFLEGRLDLDRIAISGHSAGGSATAQLADRDGVRVAIPMASGTPPVASETLEHTLFLGGLADAIVPFESTETAFDDTEGSKRLVGLADAGHLAFSDICEITNRAGSDILTIATGAGVCGAELAGFLFDCDPSFLDQARADAIVGAATVATLETELACTDRGATWDALASDPDVAVLDEG